jgi:hypothetical protein
MRPGRRHGSKRFLGMALVVGILSAGTYAFTNTNTVAISDAGQGANTISGYTVGDIKYNEAALNPHLVASVSFTLAPKDGGGAPTTVKASLVDSADAAGATTQTWYTCALDATTVTPTNDWLCSTGATPPAMSDLDELDVVAHD